MTAAQDAPGEDAEGLTVGAVAAALGVTVRTLHHWDAVGLVRPSGRSAAGYRRYATADVARARRVLGYRELGLPLDGIRELLDQTSALEPALQRQRALLEDRIDRLRGMADAVDRLAQAYRTGSTLTADEQVEIFGPGWQPSWFEDARRRWGDTDVWACYAERAAARDPQDWRRIAGEVAALDADLAAAVRAGLDPDGEPAAALAERHRATMGSYVDCDHALHVCLGRRYVCDPDFAAHYDGLQPGLARWLRDAIEANAARHGVDPASVTSVSAGMSRSGGADPGRLVR